MVFEERGNRSTRKKPLGARKRTKNKLNPHMASTLRFEPEHFGGRRWLSPLRHPCFHPCPLLFGKSPSHSSPDEGRKETNLKKITISSFLYYDGRGIEFCDLGFGNPNTVRKMGIEHTCQKYTKCLKDNDITLLNFVLYFPGLIQNNLVFIFTGLKSLSCEKYTIFSQHSPPCSTHMTA